jgi:hypothetical protein
VHGHGDWKQQKIGGLDAEDVADVIDGEGRAPKDVPSLVSVTGCSLARDKSSDGYGLLGNSVDSFASNLHRLLWENHKLQVYVFARVYDVGVGVGGLAYGRKGVYTKGAEVPDSIELAYQRSKVLYYWHNSKQFRKWVNYADKRFDDIK